MLSYHHFINDDTLGAEKSSWGDSKNCVLILCDYVDKVLEVGLQSLHEFIRLLHFLSIN
jgi:hypothetical protein